MRPVDLILSRLRALGYEAKSNGEWFMSRCPAHDDHSPSLGVREEPGTGKAVVKCFAGCKDTDVLRRLGLGVRDLFAEGRADRSAAVRSGITLEELAKAKGLPGEFLSELGLETTWAGKPREAGGKTLIQALVPEEEWEAVDFRSRWREILIRYHLPDGDLARRHRRRFALTGQRKFAWTGGKADGAIVPYGLERLKHARRVGYLILVEGESDCWALWHHGFPALGVPGARQAKTLKKDYLRDIPRVYAMREPDQGGESFLEGVRDRLESWKSWEGQLFRVELEDVKDASELHLKDAEGFKAATDAALEAAEQVQLSDSGGLEVSPVSDSDDGRPKIVVSGVQLDELTERSIGALVEANDPPAVYVRAGTLTRVTQDEKWHPGIEQLERMRVRYRLAKVARWISFRKVNHVLVECEENPPVYVADNILARGKWPFPPLEGIAQAPILRPDGTVCTTPGYDPPTRLVYVPSSGVDVPEISERPTAEEVQAAAGLLLNLIADFPFVDDASRANSVALLLSVLMRPVIAGHVPLAVIDAPVQGTGKSLLVSVLATVATGGVSSESIPSKQNEDEWRKKITSILLRGWPLVQLDNIRDNTTIDSPSLAAVITSHEWSDRILGRSESLRLPARAVWAATGNNLRVTGDMPRRCYTVRLDANTERPWERTGFRHEDIEGYAAERRGELLHAVFTLVRAWFAAGCPQAAVPVIGSFQEWARKVGGVLAHAGISGFLGNLGETRSVQDDDSRQWQAFFQAWWETIGEKAVTVDEVCQRILAHESLTDEALPDPLLTFRDKGSGPLKRSLGRHLSRLRGRVFDGYKLRMAGKNSHRKVLQWCLETVGSTGSVSGEAKCGVCGVKGSLTPQITPRGNPCGSNDLGENAGFAGLFCRMPARVDGHAPEPGIREGSSENNPDNPANRCISRDETDLTCGVNCGFTKTVTPQDPNNPAECECDERHASVTALLADEPTMALMDVAQRCGVSIKYAQQVKGEMAGKGGVR